ncbi:C40 family peptidase [Filibacter tadaridae]|uniref:Gamma-D-glutamyl-L-lysine endopeptidase n=1 Tax=Filibacter tadaridae TaxID=2483811 RepID=A0A3P5WL68_9BACL|nr:C40 family peptidase [Filibacter tadaridae]VDC21622.1 Gamma-D-glutamyl-L-lysine endopeptidase [Filibacter tadaridae]
MKMETTLNTWYCSVSVASVWTSPESARAIDELGLINPVRLNDWLEKLPYEQRLDLCDGNRIQTQLLYGEPVILEGVQGDWAKVIAVWQPSKKDERGYPGWVPLAQLKEAQPIDAQGFAKVTVGKAQLLHTDGTPLVVVPMNTLLPYVGEEGDYLRVCTPDGYALLLNSDAVRAPSIHQFAKSPPLVAVDKGLTFLDLPYFWGGMSSYGYDCSGFTYNMLKACGHSIPRDAGDQARGGVEILMGNVEQWEKGDLLFFANDEGQGNVRHVGFYYGNGLILHSPSTGKSIELLKLAGSSLESELCAVRRYGTVEG